MSYLPRKPYLIALAATFGLVLFYHFGGAIWRPIKLRLAGEKPVGQVLRELEPSMSGRFQDLETLTDGKPITILAFKEEQRLELWKRRDAGWVFVRSYPFTGFSGKPGPKLREGDDQIPEGVYGLEYLNPNSSFHLSIKVDYPNSFDREMAEADGRERLGYDIFIHGSNATIGCIPIGDQNIEELFYIVAKNGHQSTTLIISPSDFRLGKTPPEIDGIDWEVDLYKRIADRLQNYPAADAKQK